MGKIDQALSEPRLGSLDGLDLGTDLARLVVDKGFVMGWNLDGSHIDNFQLPNDKRVAFNNKAA